MSDRAGYKKADQEETEQVLGDYYTHVVFDEDGKPRITTSEETIELKTIIRNMNNKIDFFPFIKIPPTKQFPPNSPDCYEPQN